MTTLKRTDSWRAPGLILIAASILLLWPVTVLALPTCSPSVETLCMNGGSTTADCDGDGFTDAQECGGVANTAGTSGKAIAGCTETGCGVDTLDPKNPDLFYLVSDTTDADLAETNAGEPSLLYAALTSDSNALKVYADGLKVRTHRLIKADCGPDRLVIGTGAYDSTSVRAAKIIESFCPEDQPNCEAGYIGSTPQSKPTDKGVASTIYTKRIKANVDTNCSKVATGNCKINGTTPLITNANGNAEIYNYYILQVVSHEMGHGSKLAGTSASSYYHYSRTGTVMDPAATFSKGIYTIPTLYNPKVDPGALTLK